MKKLLTVATVLLMATVLKAQDTSSHKMMHRMHHEMQDCVMMKNNKMVQMKDGKVMDVTSDITLSDGSTVMDNGKMKKKDGTTTTLKNGDCVMMDGTMKQMVSMSKKKMM